MKNEITYHDRTESNSTDPTQGELRDLRRPRLEPADSNAQPFPPPSARSSLTVVIPSIPYRNNVLYGDCLERLRELQAGCVQTCVTSPPYFGLRNYGASGQIGLERSPEEYVAKLVAVFREVRRVLRRDGTVWLNIGDSYAGGTGGAGARGKTGQVRSAQFHSAGRVEGVRPKNLIGIPWRVAFALQDDGWDLRSDIIWHKPNATPESVRDRPTRAYEHVFLLSHCERYYYDAAAISEPCTSVRGATRNKRNVWTISTKPSKGDHPAAFPPALPEICIRAGSRPGDLVLDPFAGSGTTLAVAASLGRDYIGVELNETFRPAIEERLRTGR